MAASLATALANTGASRQAKFQASKIATKRKLAEGASSLGSQAAVGRVSNRTNPSAGNLVAPNYGQFPQPANNNRAFQNNNLGNLPTTPEAANNNVFSQYDRLSQSDTTPAQRQQSEFQRNQFQARVQAQVEAQEEAQNPLIQLKDMTENELSRFMWRGGSLATVVEWEGLMMWLPSGFGVLLDSVAIGKTIFPVEKGSLLDKATPPPIDPKHFMDIALIVKLGVLLLVLTAVAGIVMIIMGAVIAAAAGLGYATSILGETIVGFLTNSVLGI